MDVEIEHSHHHHKTGHRWLDLLLPLSALLISIVSIAIALHHGKVMQSLVQQNERLVQANSLPYIELGFGSGDATGNARVTMLAINSGVGPAQIRSVVITVDGRPVANLKELMDACCGGRDDTRVLSSTLLHRMIRVGETLEYVLITGMNAEMPAAQALSRANNMGRVVTTICYCSVFEECWINASHGMDRPKRVEACPMPKVLYKS